MGRKSNAQKAAEAAAVANQAAKRQELSVEKVEQSEPNSLVRMDPRDNERDDAMDEILAKRGQIEEPETKETETTEPETKDSEVSETKEPETKEPESVEPKKVRVKVDGEEFEVPQEEIDAAGSVAIYQRERAAENRLRKTNESLAETRRIQAQIAQWLEQNTPKAIVETDDQFITARMESVRFGTPEESALAMKEILGRTNKPVDANLITTVAINRIREDAGIDVFKKEFSDIVSSPLLLKLASTLENEKKQQLKQVPDWNEFYRSIGNEIRSVVGRQNQTFAKQADGNTSQPDKEERKSSIVNLPTAASRAAVPEAQKPETREDVLNEMRKARGLLTG